MGADAAAPIWARLAAEQGAAVRWIVEATADSSQQKTPRIKGVEWLPKVFEEADLHDCEWLLVTLADPDRCKAIAQIARRTRVWSSFLHFPDWGQFTVPWALNFETLKILLPGRESDPKIAEKISQAWSRLLPAEFSRALQLLRSVENKIEEQVKDRKFWPRVFDSLFRSPFSELVCAARWETAEALAGKLIQSYSHNPERRQRISPRVGVNISVHFRVGNHPYSGKIFNLSRDGAFIATKDIFSELTYLTAIKFTLPDGEQIHDAEGFVVWKNSLENPRAPIYPPGFGLMFDSLSEGNLLAIEKFVQSQLR